MLKLYWDEGRYREETAALNALEAGAGTLVVGVDLAAPAQAAVALLQARRQGIHAVAYCVAADPLEAMLGRVGEQISSSPDPLQQQTHLTALRDGQLTVGGVAFASSAPLSREVGVAAYFITQVADTLAIFTSGDVARWSAIIGKPLRDFTYLPMQPIEASPRRDSGITVYAPSTPRAMLGFVSAALQMRGCEATYITAENALELPQTPVVIAPEWWRPARGLALAAAGFRVVSPLRSAISTRVRAFEYPELSADGLGAAVDAALSAQSVCALWSEPSKPAQPPQPQNGPLVSIVVRTFDRPKLLARAIRSIAAQTYENVEIVVVNNGGPDVEDVVRNACALRHATYVRHNERATISTASNLGVRAAAGEYIGYLDDDDLLYPDHVARAVDALQRSGADLAYSDCLGEYAIIENGRKSVLGIGVYLDREFKLESLYATNLAPIHSIVHRRDVFERFGYFDESLPVTDDWDLWLRVAHGGRFIHIGRPTCEYSWRIDPASGNMTMRHQQDFVDCYKRITGHWSAEVAQREDIRNLQAQTLAVQEQRVAALAADPGATLQVLLGPLLHNAVAVRGLLDEEFAPS